MIWFVYMLLQIWQAGYEYLFSAFHLPNLSSFYMLLRHSLPQAHTYIHTDTYSQMIQRRWQENWILPPFTLFLSYTWSNADEAQSVDNTLGHKAHALQAARWHGSLCFLSYINSRSVCLCMHKIMNRIE